MDMRWGCSGTSGRHRLAHGNPKRRIFSAATGLRSMSYPHGSPRGGLTSSCWRCRRGIPVVAFLMLLQPERRPREGDPGKLLQGGTAMTTRRCVSGVVSATLATIVLTGASWAEDVRPPAVCQDAQLSRPAPPCDGLGSVREQARETVYAQDCGWRHDAPRGRWGHASSVQYPEEG